MTVLIIHPDIECKVYVDTELHGIAKADDDYNISLSHGAYWVECVSVENPSDRTDFDFRTDGSEQTRYRDIALKPIRYSRLISQYDSIGKFCCGLAKVTKNGKNVGCINTNGDLVYDDAVPFGDDKVCVCKKSLWGIVNSLGEYVVEQLYKKIEPIDYAYAIFDDSGKLGLLDSNGTIIIKPKYADLKKLGNCKYFGCEMNSRWGILNYNGEKLTPLKFDDVISVYNDVLLSCVLNNVIQYYNIKNGDMYDWIRLLKNDYIMVRVGGKRGYINSSGDVVIPIIYDYAYAFYDDIARVVLGEKMGCINRYGETIVPIIYDCVGIFRNGVVIVGLNGKYGCVNKAGDEVLAINYDYIRYRENLIEVVLNGKHGLFKIDGVEIVPTIYDSIGKIEEGAIKVSIGGKWGYINMNGEEIIPVIYDVVEEFHNGAIKVSLDGEFWFLIKKGDDISQIRYRLLKDFNGQFNEWAMVEKDGKKGFINTDGDEVVPCKYSRIFTEDQRSCCGLMRVSIGQFRSGMKWSAGKWGYIDKTGNEAIHCMYDRVSEFRESMAAVRLNGKWGFIDKTGKEVVSFKYDEIYDYGNTSSYLVWKGNLRKVKMNGLYGAINIEDGKEVIPCKYESIEYFYDDDIMRVARYGRYGLIDKTGKKVAPCIYDWIKSFKEGLAVVAKEDYYWSGNIRVHFGSEIKKEYGFIDKTGEEVIPCKYEDAKDFHDGIAEVKLDGKHFYINRYGVKIKDM